MAELKMKTTFIQMVELKINGMPLLLQMATFENAYHILLKISIKTDAMRQFFLSTTTSVLV